MEDEVVLHIKGDYTLELEVQEKGISRTKLISLQTLASCIRQSLSTEVWHTGLLPQNMVSISYYPSAKQTYLIIEAENSYADITYMETMYEHFPLPRLLFGFMVEPSGRISRVNVGIPAQGKLTPESTMYLYPFSNVTNFSMCIGANPLPCIRSFQSLNSIPDFILSLPDNDDLYQEQNNRLHLGHRDLLEHLRDKDRQYYYDKVLVPMPGKTMHDFITRR